MDKIPAIINDRAVITVRAQDGVAVGAIACGVPVNIHRCGTHRTVPRFVHAEGNREAQVALEICSCKSQARVSKSDCLSRRFFQYPPSRSAMVFLIKGSCKGQE